MQIVQEGKYPEENKITCQECGCIFQYYNSEIITDMTTSDGFGVYKHIHCPQCNTDCEISYEFTEYKSIFQKIKEKFKKEE